MDQESPSPQTLTRADLSQEIYYQMGFSRVESIRLVEDIFEIIATNLEQGKDVKISGFGTFAIKSKSRRLGRNPKTGEKVYITPRKVLSFRSSPLLKNKINFV